MNFYQKHIGDFNNKTRHLTRVERSLYSDAIELYYDTEKPLTSDVDVLAKLLLAKTKEEKIALNSILSEFFELTPEGYFNSRCDREIKKYQAFKESRSKAGKASAQHRANTSTTSDEHVLNTRSTNHKPITNNHKPSKRTKEFVPPSLDEVIAYCKENGYSVSLAKRAFDGYAAADWHDSSGKKILNWKQKMCHVWFKNNEPSAEHIDPAVGAK